MTRLPFLVLVVLSSLAHAAPPARQKLAVLKLGAVGVEATTAAVITNALVAGLAKDESVEVISQNDLAAMLSFEQQKQLAGCEESSCLVELGGALGAAQLVTGSVDKLGSTYVINAQLLDVAAARVLRRASERAKSDDEMLDATDRVASALRPMVPPAPAPAASPAIAPEPVAPTSEAPGFFATHDLAVQLFTRVPFDFGLNARWRSEGGLYVQASASVFYAPDAYASHLAQNARAPFKLVFERGFVTSLETGWDFGEPDGLRAGLIFASLGGNAAATTTDALATASGQDPAPRDAPATINAHLNHLGLVVAWDWVFATHFLVTAELGLLKASGDDVTVKVDTTEAALEAVKTRLEEIGTTARSGLARDFQAGVQLFGGVRAGWLF